MVNEILKFKINNLYFNQQKTITDISNELKLERGAVLRAINRGNFYKFKSSKSTVKNDSKAIEIIANEVSNYFGLKDNMINMRTKLEDIIIPRQIAHTLSYNLTKSSNVFVGREIGGLDHATVTNSRKIILQELTYKNDISSAYEEIEKICKIKLDEYKSGKIPETKIID